MLSFSNSWFSTGKEKLFGIIEFSIGSNDSVEDTTGSCWEVYRSGIDSGLGLIGSNDSLEDATGSDLELLWLRLCLFDITYSEVSLYIFCIEFSVFFSILSKLVGTILIFF